MGFFSKIIFGVDLEEEQARGNELDKKIAEQQARDINERKVYTQEQYDRAPINDLTGDVNASVRAEFIEGAKDGARNVVTFATETVPGAINKTLSTAVWSVLKSIPLSVWIIGAIVLFFYAGGAVLLRNRMAKL